MEADFPLPTHPDWPFPLRLRRGEECREIWIDPWFGRVRSAEDGAAYVEDLRRAAMAVAGPHRTVGFTAWKRWAVAPFFAFPTSRLDHGRHLVASDPARPVLWGRPAEVPAGVLLIEDGFLRSVGLGVHGTPPTSLAIDGRGAYYDPTRPSDLEVLLETAEVDAALTARAVRLRSRLIESGLTKYNVGKAATLPDAGGRRRLLVPGQVEDDASIRWGAPAIHTNADLLAAARRGDPDAFIVYKPHPDVVGGRRRGVVPEEVVAACADAVVTDVDMSACLAWADRLETMTSLAGFEALMRGKPVRVHGLPFYAGWGLTDDVLPAPRRHRRRSLDDLIAIALVLYPRYTDPETRLPAPVEIVVERLIEQRRFGLSPRERMRRRWLHWHSQVMHLADALAQRFSNR